MTDKVPRHCTSQLRTMEGQSVASAPKYASPAWVPTPFGTRWSAGCQDSIGDILTRLFSSNNAESGRDGAQRNVPWCRRDHSGHRGAKSCAGTEGIQCSAQRVHWRMQGGLLAGEELCPMRIVDWVDPRKATPPPVKLNHSMSCTPRPTGHAGGPGGGPGGTVGAGAGRPDGAAAVPAHPGPRPLHQGHQPGLHRQTGGSRARPGRRPGRQRGPGGGGRGPG